MQIYENITNKYLYTPKAQRIFTLIVILMFASTLSPSQIRTRLNNLQVCNEHKRKTFFAAGLII